MRYLLKKLVRDIKSIAGIILIGIVVVGLTVPMARAATFTVEFTNNNSLSTQTATSSNPVTATFSTSANHTTATGTGFAGNGTITNFITSNRNTNIFFANGSTTSTVTSAYDDIVFFNIADLASTASVMVSVSADYNATSSTPGAIWGSTFEVFGNLAGSSFGIAPFSILNTSVSGSLLSSMVSVNLNTVYSYFITGRLRNFLTAGSSNAGSGITINSNSEVAFPTFILPEGIGVSSPSLFPPTSVVPLPAAFPLFGTGLGILGFLGWRRRRQAQAV